MTYSRECEGTLGGGPYLKQHCCMGITLLTKEITPKNIFYRNEIQYRDDVPTKRKVGM